MTKSQLSAIAMNAITSGAISVKRVSGRAYSEHVIREAMTLDRDERAALFQSERDKDAARAAKREAKAQASFDA